MCVYALNSNCFLYQPIRRQYLSPWQLISKSAFSFQAACFSAVCLCVPLWTCAAVMPHNFAQYATADRWPDHVCVCVCECVCVSGSAAISRKWKMLFFFSPPWLCMQIEERNVSSDSWHFVTAVASESIFICLEERLAPRLEKHRQATQGSGFWLPAREGATQQSMLGVMTKNNGVLPHNWGSSIMISPAAALAVLYIKVQLKFNCIFFPAFRSSP